MCNSCPGGDLFVPPQKRVRDKKQRLKHPFQGVSTKKNGKGYCLNLNQKDLPTQHLDASEFLGEIQSYLANLSKEDCCVSVLGEARKCKCLQFVADKPGVVKAVSLALQNYFHSIEPKRKLMLANDQRQADRLSKFTKDSRRYLLPVFVGELDGSDNELREDLSEAMEHSICHSAWSTLYNLGRKRSDTIKEIAKGTHSMTHGNKGKRHVDEEREKAYSKITDTLTNLQENFSTPFATRIVRDNVGRSSLRDNNEYVYLPPSFSKRQSYLGVCHKAGWKPAWLNRAKGKLKPIREWQPREGFFLPQNTPKAAEER